MKTFIATITTARPNVSEDYSSRKTSKKYGQKYRTVHKPSRGQQITVPDTFNESNGDVISIGYELNDGTVHHRSLKLSELIDRETMVVDDAVGVDLELSETGMNIKTTALLS